MDLPIELVLQVLQDIPPPELTHFYCLNRHFHILTTAHYIEYHRLKKTYSTCLNTKTPGSIAALIKLIVNEPRVALYVQHLSIDGICNGWEEDTGDGLEHNKYSDADMALLQVQIKSSDSLLNWQKASYTDDVQVGDEACLIALALTLLPNIRSIEFQVSHALVENFQGTILAVTENAGSSTKCAPLSSLHTVSIDSSVDEEPEDSVKIDAINAFSKLPSVRVINADRVSANSQALESFAASHFGPSNVTNLNFSRSNISAKRLMLLLENYTLQSFTYWPSQDRDYQPLTYEPFLIVKALAACSHNSLRELRIRSGSAIFHEYLGTLQHFTALEYLETDVDLIFGVHLWSTVSFNSVMPTSIRQLRLFGGCLLDRSLHRRCFEAFIDSKATFEDLSRVEFVNPELLEEDEEDLKHRCKKAKVSLDIVRSGCSSLLGFTRGSRHYTARSAREIPGVCGTQVL